MDLRQTTEWLLRAPDIGKWLRLADSYIQSYNRIPNQFVLPREHAILKPVIDAFALDTQAFATFIRALRDGCDGVAYDELHEIYRTVSVRALQAQRRTRIRRATLLLAPKVEDALGHPLRYDDEVVLSKFIEQRWGVMRMSAMAQARNERTKKRLPTEERSVLLEQFWRNLDKSLDAGEVPLGGQVDEDFKEAVKLFAQ